MEFEEYLVWLQWFIEYRFRSLSLLQKALTAPGAEGEKEGTREEKDKYEGNRKLAPIGSSLIPLAVRQKAFHSDDASQSEANNILKTAVSRTHQAERAKSLDIHSHIKLNIRSRGVAEPNTLCLAMCAILGAVWQDSEENLSIVANVLKRLFIDIETQSGVNPSSIFLSELANVNEFVDHDVLDDDKDATSSDITLPSLSSSINNLMICDIPSLETQVEQSYYGSSIPLQVPVPRATSRETTSYQIPLNEVKNISQQSSGNADILDDEFGLYYVSNDEMENMLRNNASGSPFSAELSPINGFSRSNSSFLEVHSFEEVSAGSPLSNLVQSVRPTPLSDAGGSFGEIFESIESPLQSHLDSNEEFEAHLQDEGASAFNSSVSRKRRKSAPSRAVSRSSKSAILDEYILMDKVRYQLAGLPSPETGLDSALMQALKAQLLSDDVFKNLKILYYGIGSPESLVGLREILKVWRRLTAGKEATVGRNLSPSERIKQIDRLNENITYYNLLRRCHIHQLYVDCSAGSRRKSDSFVINTTRTVATRASPQTGNPNYLEDSRVADLIMSEVYPGLVPDTAEYKKQRRYVGDLRKLGERLDLLVDSLGYGILGQIPATADEPTGQLGLNVTNNMILSIPNKTFVDFVMHLKHLHGGFLRETSQAVSEIVQAIFHGEADRSVCFSIELPGQAEILKYPRGSQELLRLIS